MTTPRDIATSQTANFVRRHISNSARILEVGCGAGDLAFALSDAYHLLALDSDPAEVESARTLGVDARVAAWPDFSENSARQFDAVLFTRSLHHIEKLGAAVAAASESLAGRGTVLVEDFAYADASRAAREWIAEVVRLLHRADALAVQDDSFLTRLLGAEDASSAWDEEHHHEHELHTAGAMGEALRARFSEVECETAPYLYRYLIAGLPQDERGAQLLSAVLRLEIAMGSADPTFWVGRRWIARP